MSVEISMDILLLTDMLLYTTIHQRYKLNNETANILC
jgi:hypothetical protein